MASLPSKSSTSAIRSEDILSAKTDLCLSNAIVKTGLGFGAGVLASAVLFRRRPWPVLMGVGFGLGQGYSDCERVFNPAAVPGYKIVESTNATPAQGFSELATAKLNTAWAQTKEAVQQVEEKVVGKAKAVEAQVEKKVEKKEEGKKLV